MDQRFGNALLLRLRAARAIDVGARAIVIAIEKQHAGPEIDGRFELAREIVIEPRHEEMLDAPFVFGARRRLGCGAGLTFAGRPWVSATDYSTYGCARRAYGCVKCVGCAAIS